MNAATLAGRRQPVQPVAPGQRAADYLALTKPGITRLVLVTTAAGFYLGSAGTLDLWLLAHTLLGTGLVAGGTNALNQYAERGPDGRMRRTRNRPIPSGRLAAGHALRFAVSISAAGLLYLTFAVGWIPALVAASCLATYIFLYTPLKRRTTYNTMVGAVPGALPIVLGWTAAGGSLAVGAWVLFGILFLWQLPHFLALAWMYREDYRQGGFVMLTVLDPDGRTTGRQILNYVVALLPVSLLPTLIGMTGPVYFFGALVLGAIFVGIGVAVTVTRAEREARRLFLASVLYLPALLLLMVIDKVPA